ncbi:hypothetical protein [Caballeronia sp. LZ050]|uniref:hypothetical protein n=1 Tax=Caballeronia sp. LZ050 TaxID=3038570 RepID=UPI0038579CE3
METGVTAFWRQYVGLNRGVIRIDRFGESAPAREPLCALRRDDGGVWRKRIA